MHGVRWFATVIVASLLVIGCEPAPSNQGVAASSPSSAGTSPTGALRPTPTFEPPPSLASGARQANQCSQPQRVPEFSASTASNRNLALVSLGQSDEFVVRDVTNIDHPFTASSLGSLVDYGAVFVNANELSDAIGDVGLFRMPLDGSARHVVTPCGAKPLAWSPDGTQAAYVAGTADPKVEALHLVTAGLDRVVDSMPAQDFGVGCEASGPGCADNWEISLLFSPDGAFISFMQQLPVSVFRIWTRDGVQVKALDGTTATMQVWSGNTLYWRDDKGVEAWRNGIQSLVLPGVQWVRPHASSAGGQIVFEVRDAKDATAHVRLLKVATGSAQEVAASRSEPAFLTARYLWYLGEDPCSAPDPCVGPTKVTAYYIRDLQTGTEYLSVIKQIWDVWPHPA